jgi:ubiquitin
MSTIGAGAAAAVAVAMLAALPAHAGSGLIKITHSDTPYKRAVKPASSTVAKAQPAASQAKPAEIQVGVMAKSPSQPAAKHAVFIRR